MDFAIRLCLMFASKVLLSSLNRFVLSKSSPRIGGTSTSRSSSRMAGDDSCEEQGDRGPRRSSSRMAGADICEEQGDLFSAPSTTSLAHCVSSDLKMGAGIAVLFRKKFGRVENLKNQEKSVGEVAYLQDGPRFIFYLITKQWFYDKPTEATLLRSLLEMRDLCDQFGVRRLAMPRIGCGLDGLQWPVVYEMIIEVFSQCDMKVTIYTMPDRNSMTQKSMTPNFLRTQEKFRNFFEPKRPSSLPSSLMASKRKMYMHPSDDEYDTPKKRLKNSSFDDSRYQRNNSFSQPTSKISHHSSNFDTSDEDNYSYNRREKKATDSPWSKSFSSPQDVDKNDFWSTPQRYRGPIPYLSDGETKEESYTRDSKRSSYSISDYDKKEKSKVQDKYLSDEDEYSKPRDSAKKRMSQLQESPDYNCESKREMKRKDSSRSKERESRASTESDERKCRDSSRGKERKSRDSSRSKERKSRDSSRSKERKSRDSSRSKERKSKKTSRSKERKSRDSCEKKERKSRDSSRSKDKKSRDSSRSKDRKSKDSSRSKDRKSRDSSRSKERKHRDTSKRRVRESSESSEGAEREYGHSSKNQMSKFQLSDQSDNESIDNTSVTTRTEERYQRYEEHSPEGSMTVSVRKVLTSTQRGRQSNNVTEYSESHKEKKIVQKYPALNISLIKSALRGGMYSDREDTNGNSRKRNH